MDPLVAGWWGAFFGSAALLFAGGLAALARSLRRVALLAAFSAVAPSLFAASYLGLVPLGSDPPRVLAHVGMVTGGLLGLMVLAMLGLMRRPHDALRLRASMAVLIAVVIGAGWFLTGTQALVLSTCVGVGIGGVVLMLCLRRVQRGDRLAVVALTAVAGIVVALGLLSWHVLHPGTMPWQGHAVAAVAGMAYVASVALVLWLRYSWLLELRDVIAHGPAYDPITRMRSHKETGQMVGLAFFDQKLKGEGAVGVVVVSIGNLLALEQLHGKAAVNHALFVTAGRLRRSLPLGVDAGRLGEDAFLLLVRHAPDRSRLCGIARLVADRLSRPVRLVTSELPHAIEDSQAHWVAQVGIGLLAVPAGERPSAAIEQARAMSRAAWSYPSRVASRDAAGEVAEVSRPVPA